MTHLSYLDAGNNLLPNVSPVATLTGLGQLYLNDNDIFDLSPLARD